MPTSGPTFTDWEQLEADDRRRPLLIDEDFSWSEPPAPRRRGRAYTLVLERERHSEPQQQADLDSEPGYEPLADGDDNARYEEAPGLDPWGEPIDVEHELDVAWGGRLSVPTDETAPAAEAYEIVPYEFSSELSGLPSGRRTVVITGRGAERYAVTTRRSRNAGLSFHERSGFNPDRTAKWAVLLGIALLLGCIAH